MYLSGSVQQDNPFLLLGSMERLIPSPLVCIQGHFLRVSHPQLLSPFCHLIPSDWVNVPLKTQFRLSSGLDSTAKTLLYLLEGACS